MWEETEETFPEFPYFVQCKLISEAYVKRYSNEGTYNATVYRPGSYPLAGKKNDEMVYV